MCAHNIKLFYNLAPFQSELNRTVAKRDVKNGLQKEGVQDSVLQVAARK